jgi:N-acetylglucosaminyldiphosphoundecaprenol N-acetyl-beta-D-mannosaminyltransferase
MPERINVLKLPLDLVDLPTTVEILREWLKDPNARRTVITLNPEICIQAEADQKLRRAILGVDLSTPDGVGMLWAAKRLTGKTVSGRATGVDIVQDLMKLEGEKLRVFFFGAKPGVAERAAENCVKKYGIHAVGFRDGYFNPEQRAGVAEEIREARADLLLTGLGAPRQELFNFEFRPAKINIAVGGTLDVLAGTVERAPDWAINLKIEWVWRIVKLKRWDRAKRLAQFASRVVFGTS